MKRSTIQVDTFRDFTRHYEAPRIKKYNMSDNTSDESSDPIGSLRGSHVYIEHDYPSGDRNIENNEYTYFSSGFNSPADYNSRIQSIHRNAKYNSPNHNLMQTCEARTGGTTQNIPQDVAGGLDSLEKHANLIVSKMEQDGILMEDSPTAEDLRREAVRDMPQCLTVKRYVKVKLSKSVSQKSKGKQLSFCKILKYRTSMAISKLQANVKNLAYSLELWYGPLKQIEGTFGTGVASFFKFLRWLFIMNVFIALTSICFIVIPYATYEAKNPSNNTEKFKWTDIFTGDGYFTSTTLFYGFYSKNTLPFSNMTYSVADAYFFTMLTIYFVCFAVLSFSVAHSYRRSFIETEGGLKNIYAHKIFCGWDYNIATEDAAVLKSHAIFNELKELLHDTVKQKRKHSCLELFWTGTILVITNILVIMSLGCVGYLIWILLDKSNSFYVDESLSVVIPIVIVNIVMTVFPMIFSYIIKYEWDKSPKKQLIFSLARTYLLGFVTIGVLVTYWLKNYGQVCWETSIGREIYRMVIFDFVISVLGSALFDIICYGFNRLCKRGYLEFDIARNTMQIIYNQSLFWVGLYFSPLLPVIVVIKLCLTWYIRQFVVLKLCKPSVKSWRAAQTSTWFLMMTFLSILIVGGLIGYIISYIPVSKTCGPFAETDYTYMFQIVTTGLLKLESNGTIWKILLYLTKPGFIAFVLIALCARVYYLRAKAQSQRGIVKIYREMLVWEARDKEFLLNKISKVTKGQWQYNLHSRQETDPVHANPDTKFGSKLDDLIYRGVSSSTDILNSLSSDSTEPSSSGTSFNAELESDFSKYKKFS